MEDRKLNEKESLELIAQMIRNTRRNLDAGGVSILARCTAFLDPFARLLGLDGVILMAFILGIPANYPSYNAASGLEIRPHEAAPPAGE